ncbi:ATP-binding protein [Nocardia macrotermitis]|uniref:ATP-dependent zinc metalloprotease FtsH n=1 Tax=Nocardia macrotermitis TaxID=2585198 RepID=A0A7K0CWK9_9NOCA|nr:ATP-binding protein [Nocardia macrotermitis]MQY17885.1 ATP-dependent zinc metalloprotease FtsH [Nocardia macrotermitis]
MTDDPVLSEMLRILETNPELLPVRIRVIELLADRLRHTEALTHCATALGMAPGNPAVLDLLQRCTAALASGAPQPSAQSGQTHGASPDRVPEPGATDTRTPTDNRAGTTGNQSADTTPQRGESADQAGNTAGRPGAAGNDAGGQEVGAESDATQPVPFDWAAAEREVGDIIAPAFVNEAEVAGEGELSVNEEGEPVAHAEGDVGLFERPGVGLADVGGMENVKRQLEVSLLGPLRNPELAKAFGTSARGGLLLYGPPGCGKTFIAAAVAGELGANFYPVEIADILDIYTGSSERNLHQIFEVARRNAPCVLFIDEVDALGHKRSQMSGSATMRTVVNQLLTEMDSATVDNEGVYLLGATNHPWDIDVALRRPGRFDRMILVTLPDRPARTAILRRHLKDRPVSGIDLAVIAKRTDGFSGADLAHVCTSATQLAMADSMRTGTVRPVTMRDIDDALAQVKPSAGAWFESARNVVEFANNDGTYDELAKYMREKKFR